MQASLQEQMDTNLQGGAGNQGPRLGVAPLDFLIDSDQDSSDSFDAADIKKGGRFTQNTSKTTAADAAGSKEALQKLQSKKNDEKTNVDSANDFD